MSPRSPWADQRPQTWVRGRVRVRVQLVEGKGQERVAVVGEEDRSLKTRRGTRVDRKRSGGLVS